MKQSLLAFLASASLALAATACSLGPQHIEDEALLDHSRLVHAAQEFSSLPSVGV